MSENSIDIALVQETYLKPNRPKACSITGYVQLRTDRTYSSKGGTALYYRRSLHCGPINIPPLTNMEATGCRLAMTGHSTLVIVSVYLPSPKRLLRRDLRALFALGDAVILFGALTNHVRTVVEESEREVPASSDRRKFPPDILELIRAKNAALRRASAYPTPEYRSRARALQREVKARVREFRNESWSDLMEEIKPSHKAFWAVTKALKTEGYTLYPTQNLIIQWP
ncbi:hypothetical protein EVAR_33771_1 [Eumeta japonica]|uniref:RNA-directed DNA polymerase from mobile element jockey n=1 Tax=Eumeta variegata TaxID=151549 RepID=A0A4C1VVU4_EUMVA|nr:hypothetical protein EVAR_33771_1 [Eumeta japonica]